MQGGLEKCASRAALRTISRSSVAILDALKACSRTKDLQKGKLVHAEIIRSGDESDVYIASSLVNMYAKCGCIQEARSVFDRMQHRDVVSWTAIILGHAENGQGEKALELFLRMESEGCLPDGLTFVAAVKACTSLALKERDKLKRVSSLEKGMDIHLRAMRSNCSSDVRLASTLLDFYAKCGSLTDATRIFERIKHQSVVSWNALMFGYAEQGQGEMALELYSRMRPEGLAPNSLSFVAALKACSDLATKEEATEVDGKHMKVNSRDQGVAIHLDALNSQCSCDIRVASTLVDMYSKCGSMTDARKVFDQMQCHTVVSWTALILGYAETGEAELALDLFSRMRYEGCVLDAAVFVAALKTCASMAAKEEWGHVDARPLKIKSLERGRAIHVQAGCFSSNVYVANTLIDMYVKCGSVDDARSVFDAMQDPSVVSWNALMFGYADNGEGKLALELYELMLRHGCPPNALTFVAALKACGSAAEKEEGKLLDGKLVKVSSREQGMRIHSQLVVFHCDTDVHVSSTLIDMYAKCGSVDDSRKVFDAMERRTVVSWNALMFGYADNGEGKLAMDMHSRMEREGVTPNALTFVAALKACTDMASKEEDKEVEGRFLKISSLQKGMDLHSQVARLCLESDVRVASTMVDMYAKCRSLAKAREVFDGMVNRTAVSWNSLMFGYADCGEEMQALELLSRMEKEGCRPDALSFVASVKACSSLASKEAAREVDGKLLKDKARARGLAIHSVILKSNCASDIRVGNTLINMYANCCSMENARKVFNGMQQHDIVSWNALISGYVDNGQGGEALNLFFVMKTGTCAPNARSFSAALNACGITSAWDIGKSLRTEILNHGLFDSDPVLVTSLMDFYIRSGNIADAQEAFDSLHTKDLVAWITLMGGYSRHGNVHRVLELFHSMKDAGLKPNGAVLMCILTACNHAGLVEKGKEYFEAMSSRYGVSPEIEHYTCMIDMLGRANELDDAIALLQSMPCKADAVTWLTVLGACVMWKNVAVGKLAFKSLMKLDRKEPAAYVMLANIYKSCGLEDEELQIEDTEEWFSEPRPPVP